MDFDFGSIELLGLGALIVNFIDFVEF